ncbi:MAG TPA: DUF5916 domain-containing protein [Polyangia bacterium]|nr:DUF5916 domain-containing protein [Polyangia bacterium]
MLTLALAALTLAQAAALGPAGGALPPRPHLTAVRTATPPKIDGRLNDPAWRAAVPSDDFTQHYPDEGAQPTERTELRVLYDDRNLYVAIDCWQVHSPIVRRLQRRDGFLPADGVWMDIDSRSDGVSAYHFQINASGVLLDGIHYNDTNFSADYDAIWEAKVADTDHGYSAEFRIPLSSLRFTALPIQSWGFQVRRAIDARQEIDDWAYYPRHSAGFVSYFGHLDNLVDLPPPRRFELRPFVLGKLEHVATGADANATRHGFFADAAAGVDAKAHLTNELTLDLTVLPDFGQVEADTVILNLSTFETFFPEKRPFFLEGLDVFATIRPVLYTRRIGHQPALPTLNAGESLIAEPDPSAIYSAAKVSGTIGGRTTVGVMSAITGANDVAVQTPTGQVQRLVDPLTAFNVVRVKRLVAANADVGLLATATNRFEPSVPIDGRCPATQTAPAPDGRCTNDAYVLSLDGRWRSRSGDYAAAWQGIGSVLSGGPARSEPDGIPIQPGHVDGGLSLYLGKEGGTHWLWSAWQHLTGRQMEFNDLGYLERKDDYQGYFNVGYRTLRPWWLTRETTTGFQYNVRETLDGVRLWQGIALTTAWTLRNFWSFYLELNLRDRYSDDREMGDGSALQYPASSGAVATLSTDPRRRVTFAWSGAAEKRESGYGAYIQTNATFTLRLLPQMEIALLPTLVSDTGLRRYIGTDLSLLEIGDHADYRFGTQNATSVGVTMRAGYTFTPELSLQFYTQLFLASIHYSSFFVYPRAAFREQVPFGALTPAAAPSTNPDSEQATLNVNLVFRWEYRLGSTLFLVYTRAQTPALTVAPGDAATFQVAPLWRGRASDDILMVKLAYWLG